MSIFGFPYPQKWSLGEDSETFLASLGVSWAVLAHLACVWGILWVRLGELEGVLEASWGHLKEFWEDLGGGRASLGGFLAAFWEYF